VQHGHFAAPDDGGRDGRVAAVSRGSDELIALADRMTEAQGSAPVSTTVVSGDTVVLDATIPAVSLIRVPAELHLRVHMQLAGLRAGHGGLQAVGPRGA
jgi:hypothetical protein